MENKAENLLKNIGEVDDRFIEEADCVITQKRNNTKGITYKICAGVAACAASVFLIVALENKLNNEHSDPKTTQTSDTSVQTSITTNSNTAATVSTNTETSITETQPAVTEKKYTVQTNPVTAIYGNGGTKSASPQLNKYSYLDIDNTVKSYYTIDNGYYRIEFLKDKNFQALINSEIKAAMDEISNWYDPGYLAEKDGEFYQSGWTGPSYVSESTAKTGELEKTNGIVIELMCKNGYLSIALGYVDCDGFKGWDNKNERRFDIVHTLNYDIINNKKISNISQLFYDGTDVISELNNSAFNNYKTEIDKITDAPEIFTIYYVLHSNHGRFYNDYSTLVYYDRESKNSINNSLITANYRDMSGAIDQSYTVSEGYLEEKVEKQITVVEDGIEYIRFEYTFPTDKETKKMEDMVTVQRKATSADVSKGVYAKHGYNYTVSASKFDTDKIGWNNLWQVCSAKELYLYYDCDTLEALKIKDVFGENWTDYFTLRDSSEGVVENDLTFSGMMNYSDDDNYIKFSVWTTDSTGKNVYGEIVAPCDIMNTRYYRK